MDLSEIPRSPRVDAYTLHRQTEAKLQKRIVPAGLISQTSPAGRIQRSPFPFQSQLIPSIPVRRQPEYQGFTQEIAVVQRGLLIAGLFVICLGGGGCQKVPAPGPAAAAAHSSTTAAAPAPEVASTSPIRFAERTADSGVDWTYHNDREAQHSSILESLGGGVGVCDFDLDGQLDVLATGGGRYTAEQSTDGLPTGLFRGLGHWKFQSVGEVARIAPARHYSHGMAMGDFNQDGFADALITGYGGLLLWQNNGDGTFSEVAQQSGLTDTLWSTSAAWADLNRDGHLDLYVTHYVNWSFQNHPYCPGPKPELRETCSPRNFEGLPDVCYFSTGDGTFTDVSEQVGLHKDGKGLGVLAADFDVDGDVDLYVANDTVPNFLYRNDGTGKFEEIGHISGTALSDMATADGSMGVSVGDYNLDGLPDIWVANYERESFALYRNDGECYFQHVSQPLGVTGVGAMFVGFGTLFFDADLDGDEDVWVTNGHVIQYPANAPLKQVPLLFENVETKRFRNVAPQSGTYATTPHMGRGVCQADFDQDGDRDLLVSHVNDPLSLLENTTVTTARALRVRLIGRTSNRTAIGARLVLETSAGRRLRQISGGGSYLSHSDLEVVWGIPEGVLLKSLHIRWPSGQEQALTDLQPGTLRIVIEPSAGGAP